MCLQRPQFAVRFDIDRSRYRCDAVACKYPHCAGADCTTPRPRNPKLTNLMVQQWFCQLCRPRMKTCVACGEEKDADEYDDHKDNTRARRCRECVHQDRKCNVCNTMKAAEDYDNVRKLVCKICDLERRPSIPQKTCQSCSQDKPNGDFASSIAKKCRPCAEEAANEPMKCKRCEETKPTKDFWHGPNKGQALDHCAACKGHKQCDVKKCRAWRDPDAERWNAKQKILVCGACKSERGCTDKETPLTIQ